MTDQPIAEGLGLIHETRRHAGPSHCRSRVLVVVTPAVRRAAIDYSQIVTASEAYGPTNARHIRSRVFAMTGGRCINPACLRQLDPYAPRNADNALHVDHVQPKSRGGIDHMSNYQPLCSTCNTRKGARHTDYRSADQKAAWPRVAARPSVTIRPLVMTVAFALGAFVLVFPPGEVGWIFYTITAVVLGSVCLGGVALALQRQKRRTQVTTQRDASNLHPNAIREPYGQPAPAVEVGVPGRSGGWIARRKRRRRAAKLHPNTAAWIRERYER